MSKQRKQQRDKIARLISWGHWFTFVNILLALAIGLLYVEAAEATGSALGDLYLFLSWLGHFAFLPFIVFIIFIFPFCILIPYSRVLRGIATLVASIGLIALIADAIFFRQYGYHLNTYSLSRLASDAESVFAGASFVLVLGLLVSFVVLLVLQLVIANLTYKRLERLRGRKLGSYSALVFVTCFLASHSIHIWADANFYTPITKQDDLFPVSYPTTAKTLMNKHGLLDNQQAQTTGRLLRDVKAIDLSYPQMQLLCAAESNSSNSHLIALPQLDAEQTKQLLTLFPELMRYDRPVLGQTTLDSALFELVYALPSLYSNAFAAAENGMQMPAYLAQLNSYQVGFSIRQYHPLELAPATQAWLEQLSTTSNPVSARDVTIELASTISPALLRSIRQALTRNDEIMIIGLTPVMPVDEAVSFPYQVSRNSVTLLTNAATTIKPQVMAQLTDIMPTIVSRYMTCADESKNWATGVDLAEPESKRYPIVASMESHVVIYTEDKVFALDSNAQLQGWDRVKQTMILNPEVPAPVLIESLKELKRFAKEPQQEQ
ncbi:DUF3413 domain-containing protein [Pseudidiomarina taiwanensis]|uniref:Alkaline phosphatase n=1 Tax=Pseudidiomarina taiwanensis TaxID=337250 RepID=A0A432ZN49_9GAMM|nr:DUF3413 domain-containing protein [Pseudidiomarina taiwanensis]RUO79313.1 alkaline phosphatase [Pseudidiomarina taiwanensis]